MSNTEAPNEGKRLPGKVMALTGKEKGNFLSKVQQHKNQPNLEDPTNGDHFFKNKDYLREMIFLDQKKETSSKKGSKVDYEKIGEAANHFRKWLNNQENDPINSDAIRELQYILDCQRVNQN